jgi:hypothetical protein
MSKFNIEYSGNCNITISDLYAKHTVDGKTQANLQLPEEAMFHNISLSLNDN